jgi:mono/diheme cytochrome c family protein
MAALLAGGLLLASCGQDDKPPSAGSPGGGAPVAGPGGDAAKGKQTWLAQCAVCHGVDPAMTGPVGPAVKGSPKELVEARVVRAAYPPGYKPKRDTKVMPARPDLAASVPDLAAYLR